MTEDEIKSYLISKMSDISIQIRNMEDEAKLYGIDISYDNLYSSLKGYRQALNDLFTELKK